MSLRPGLLASTSRSALAALRPTAAAAPRAAIARAQYARLQSTSSKSRPEEQEGTVQHMDKLLKEREKAMKSLPRGIEGFGAPDDLVLEPFVDPPMWVRPAWLLQPTVYWKWLKERFQRFNGTQQFTNELMNDGIVQWGKVGRLTGAGKALQPTLDTFADMYEDYNRAQATGDLPILPSLATGPALARARKAARATQRLNAKWALVKVNTPATLQTVRYVPMYSADGPKLAQITVKFDTTQKLTTTSAKGRSEREMRVVENVVFERTSEANSAWRIKSFVDVAWPECEKAKR